VGTDLNQHIRVRQIDSPELLALKIPLLVRRPAAEETRVLSQHNNNIRKDQYFVTTRIAERDQTVNRPEFDRIRRR
jgi:hypothetical protein